MKSDQSNKVDMAKTKFSGFTLIELLVVISIIGILSSIVLASLANAKDKARNSAINSQVYEYYKAIELYRANYGILPPGSTGEDSTFTPCLGQYNNSSPYSLNKCGSSGGVMYPNNDFNNQIDEYIPTLPSVSKIPITTDESQGSITWLGAIFQHNPANTKATSSIAWVLKGKNQNCGQGFTPGSIIYPRCINSCTWCRIDIYNK